MTKLDRKTLRRHEEKILRGLVAFYYESGHTSEAYRDDDTGGIYENKLAQRLGYKLAHGDRSPHEFIKACRALEAQGFVRRMKRRPDFPEREIWPTLPGLDRAEYLEAPPMKRVWLPLVKRWPQMLESVITRWLAGGIALIGFLIFSFWPSPKVASPPEVAFPPPPQVSPPPQAALSSFPSISAFRVIKQTNNEVTLEADYTYDAAYGDRVSIGACLYRNGRKIGEIPQEYGGYCGYVPDKGGDPAGRVPSVGRGTARVVIRPPLREPEMSDEGEIFLKRHGYGDTVIVSRRFPFIQNWTP